MLIHQTSFITFDQINTKNMLHNVESLTKYSNTPQVRNNRFYEQSAKSFLWFHENILSVQRDDFYSRSTETVSC